MNHVRTVTHGTFTIDRSYRATPARVFAALSEQEALARWFRGPDEPRAERLTLDFRVGGGATSVGGPPGGPAFTFQSRYWDIIPNERIVYSYDMHVGDLRISVSLVTLTLASQGTGTRLVFTEQAVFFDGADGVVMREQGTRLLLDQLGRTVDGN